MRILLGIKSFPCQEPRKYRIDVQGGEGGRSFRGGPVAQRGASVAGVGIRGGLALGGGSVLGARGRRVQGDSGMRQTGLVVGVRGADCGCLEALFEPRDPLFRVSTKGPLNHVIEVRVSLLEMGDLQDVGKVLWPLAIARFELREGVNSEFEHLGVGGLPQS